jgi:leucyl aminopeptidase
MRESEAMKVSFGSTTLPGAGALVAFALADRALSATAERLDKATGGAIKRALAASRFTGKPGQALALLAPNGIKASCIVLLGLGKPEEANDLVAERAGGEAVAQLARSGEKAATVMIDKVSGMKLAPAEFAAHVAYGAMLRAYRFDKYRTKEEADAKPSLSTLTVGVEDQAAARRAYAPLGKLVDGISFTRDLVSEPANVIFPASLANRAKELGKLGVSVQILGVAEMKKLGMGALLGVAQGSVNEPRLVVMQWKGAPRARDKRPIAFVGKGVTFDTGGISIKPAASMEDMKWDMGGAGVVMGTMMALAGRKARVNAVGIAGLVENMPSGTAQRPGDVVTTMSGQTVEVINTDAEGRLVLGDAMWYCQDRFKPRAMIDLATLTGAIIVSLGHEQAGLFANDDELAGRLIAAGKAVGEPLWRMPLGEAYDRMINSDIADMKNVGSGREAGSITAAQFLKRFVQDGVAWAHLDIAGVTWSKKDAPTVPKGGTAFGVRLLDRLVREHYEG